MLLEVVEPLVTAQIRTADVIAVNKVDEVDEETLATVTAERRRTRGQGGWSCRSQPTPAPA